MTDYTKNTNFTAKDSLTSGDPAKIIKGSEFDAEFDEIATAIASKEDSANKGAANGYAPLNASSELADSYLTSNVPLLDAATNTFTGDIVAVDGTFSGTMTIGGTLISTYGLSLIDDANAAAARTTLGLGTAAVQDEGYFALAGHNHSGVYEPADAAIVKSDEAETITANWDFSGQVTFDKVYTPPVADTISGGTLTIDTDDSNVFTVSVGANITTLTLSNADQGQTINVLFTIGGVGGYTASWPASFKWANGVEGTLSTGVGDIDLLVATYIGTTWYATLLNDFQ